MPPGEPKACYRCKHFGQSESEINNRKLYPVYQWLGICENEKSENFMEFLNGGKSCNYWEELWL